MEKILYTEENLIKYGIYQLRQIARNVGVHLPTTYKKEELISMILKVQNGEIEPFVARSKKGRPPKNFLTDDELVFGELPEEKLPEPDVKTSWEKCAWITNERRLSNWGFGLSVAQPDAFEAEEHMAEGIVMIEPNNWATVHLGGFENFETAPLAIITADMAKSFDIKTGDIVSGLYNIKNEEKNIYFPKTLNGKPIDTKRIDFEKLTATKPEVIIPLWNSKNLLFTKYLTPICKGQRVVVAGEKRSGKTELLQNMAKEFFAQGLHTIFLAVDKRPEDKACFEKGIEHVFIPFDMDPFRQYYLIKLVFERAKRLCEMGQDVALVVDDLVSVIRVFDYVSNKPFSEKQDVFDLNSIVMLKKCLATAKNTQEEGSITVVGSVEQGRTEGNRLFELLDNFFNCHIYLSSDLKVLSNISVLPESFTDNLYGVLDEEFLNQGEKIRAETYGKPFKEIASVYKNKMI